MSMFLTTLLIGIALSMDAFSLSIVYGTLSLSKQKMLSLSIIVGIFHFFMPLLGYNFGKVILSFVMINSKILIGVIFTIIAGQMFHSLTKEEEPILLTNFGSLLLFGFTVSIDSFSIGIGLSGINNNIYLAALIFALTSCVFTFLGLVLGKALNKTFGKISTLIGSMILFGLGVYYFFS